MTIDAPSRRFPFPFSQHKEKGFHSVSLHDVAKVVVQGPERITDGSPNAAGVWMTRVIVTAHNGDIFVLRTVNHEDLSEKPVVEVSGDVPQLEDRWWKKEQQKRKQTKKQTKRSTLAAKQLPDGTLHVVAPGRPFTVKMFRTEKYIRDRAAKAPHTYRLVTDPAEVAQVREQHETDDWKTHAEAMEGTYDESIGRTICIEQVAL